MKKENKYIKQIQKINVLTLYEKKKNERKKEGNKTWKFRVKI